MPTASMMPPRRQRLRIQTAGGCQFVATNAFTGERHAGHQDKYDGGCNH
jgi:hypothetical protein